LASRRAKASAILPRVCGTFGVARVLFISLLAFGSGLRAAPTERSLSASRQFIVYGTDVRIRGALCDLAEQTKRDLLRVTDQRDEWATPIVINAQYPLANLPETPRTALNFSQTGFGLKLQLDLTIASDVSRPEVRRELLRAVILEMMYRARPNVAAGTDYVLPPDWLLEGIAGQQSDFEPSVTDLLAAPVAARKILPLADFLNQRPELLDAPGRALYRAYSFALVRLLIHSPDGPHRFAKFMTDLPAASNDPLANIQKHFPELSGNDGNDEKAWTTQIARLSMPPLFQLLGAAETERLLDEALRLKIGAPGSEKTYPLSEFAKWEKSSNAKSVLDGLTRELNALATRANPIYRPIVSEYAAISTLLSGGKRNGIAPRLERLSSSRKRLARQMRGIDDYMNWFEATKGRKLSGAFTDYMKAAEASAKPEPRRDPISVYLDVLEAQFQN
jgi:hypothetical protein